jgi:hypothetical protein
MQFFISATLFQKSPQKNIISKLQERELAKASAMAAANRPKSSLSVRRVPMLSLMNLDRLGPRDSDVSALLPEG